VGTQPAADVSVRRAWPADAESIAQVQIAAWREFYAPRLPAGAQEVLAATTLPEVTDGWDRSLRAAEGPAAVFLALEAGEPVGVAAVGPALAGDHDARVTAELGLLAVIPAACRHGHGSRLLAATADHLRNHAFPVLLTWVFTADEILRSFLESAGWELDGATRELDMGEPVAQQRLHTDIRNT
jgi:GNAT superfamily N-acetyltransferase